MARVFDWSGAMLDESPVCDDEERNRTIYLGCCHQRLFRCLYDEHRGRRVEIETTRGIEEESDIHQNRRAQHASAPAMEEA